MNRKKRDRDRFNRYALCIGILVSALGAYLLYMHFAARHAGEGKYSLMFTTPMVIPLVIITAVCIGSALAALLYYKGSVTDTEDDNGEYTNADDTLSDEAESSQTDEQSQPDEMTEYPELFSRSEKSTENVKTLPDIKAVLSAQTAGHQAEEDENEPEGESSEEALWNDYLYREREKETTISESLYADIPEELPEDYQPIFDEEEDDDETDDMSEDGEMLPAHAPLLKRAVFAAVMAVITVISVWSFTYVYTSAGKNGITVNRPLSRRTYSYSDAVSYEIEPSFLGNSLVMRIKMSDGRTIRIEPENCSVNKAFENEYGSVMKFAAYADAEMQASGAKKTVKNAQSLRDTYENAGDGSWTYVSCILGE